MTRCGGRGVVCFARRIHYGEVGPGSSCSLQGAFKMGNRRCSDNGWFFSPDVLPVTSAHLGVEVEKSDFKAIRNRLNRKVKGCGGL
jgi:hypothetical protein